MRYGMQSKLIGTIIPLLVLLVMLATPFGQKKQQPKRPPREVTPEQLERHKETIKPPTGASFYLERIADGHNQFSLLFTDADGRTVSGVFYLNQLSLFEALLVAASEFADTDEAVGTTAKPITTRFKDKKEPSFAVDVEKIGRHSRFYVSVNCLTGKLTVDAGAIKRGDKDRGSILFLSILSRVKDGVAEGQ
jgi:hypothetical protein